MPWNRNDYPPSMKNLDERTRNKAIEIANALLDQYEEGRAIAIATAQAKEWSDNHPEADDRDKTNVRQEMSGKEEQDKHRKSTRRTEDNGEPEADLEGDPLEGPLHVVPHGGGWVVKEAGRDAVRFHADTKAVAVEQAKEWASEANISAIVHRKDGTVETAHNYS